MKDATIRLSDLCHLISEPIKPSARPDALYLGLEHLTPGRLVRTGGGQASKRRPCGVPHPRSNPVTCCTGNSVRISTKPCSLTRRAFARRNYLYYVRKQTWNRDSLSRFSISPASSSMLSREPQVSSIRGRHGHTYANLKCPHSHSMNNNGLPTYFGLCMRQ